MFEVPKSTSQWAAQLVAAVGAGAAIAGISMKLMEKKKQTAPRVAPTFTTSTDADFKALFGKLVEKFLVYIKRDFALSQEHMDRLKWLLEYNCVGGKCYRATLAISATKTMCESAGVDYALRAEQSMVLGWCVEILQACFLVADDIMDASTTRRGQPCWYLQPTIKLDAVNDTLILESFIYHLLKDYFADSEPELYIKLVEIFHTVSLQTQIGQMLDCASQPQGKKGPEVMKGFNLDLYQKIVKFKTACYTFYLPLASGMLLAGVTDEQQFDTARDICMEIGEKFQVQDDYLDCYQDPAILGKIGTDIHDHKCSWLCVQALERMTPAQREMFESTYGNDDAESEAKVKQLYRDLKLGSVYAAQEAASFARIEAKIAEATKIMPDLFTAILKKIHGRQK